MYEEEIAWEAEVGTLGLAADRGAARAALLVADRSIIVEGWMEGKS